jgi:membrane protein
VGEPEERIADLTKQGAVERRRLASTVQVSAEAARETARRVRPIVRMAAVGAAATGLGLLVAGVVRRVRSNRRQPRAWKKLRRSFADWNERIDEQKPRPVPVTLILALARSKTVRRAIASAATRLWQSRAEDSISEDRDRHGRPNGPPRSLSAGAPEDSGDVDRLKQRPPDISDVPPPPVPKEEAKEAPLPRKFGIGVALFKASYGAFGRNEGFSRAASLAYYTVFSLAPLLVIAVAVAGFVFGREAAQGRLLHEIRGMVGPDAAKTLQTLMAKAQKPSANVLATIFGVLTLLFGAAGVFGNLQQSLNRIWGVPENPHGGFWKMVQQRFLSLAMVLGTGFLLLVSLVISAALSAVGDLFRRDLSGALGFLWNGVNALVSWAVVGVVFALIFKYLPDARIRWNDVWIGAAITSLLFALGQFALGLYIGKTSVSSVYGGAASLAIVLIWTYYSAAIFFFGAEITKTYAAWYGSARNAGSSSARARALAYR